MACKNPEFPTIKLDLDQTVERQKDESVTHWAMKAAIVAWLKAHPHFEGVIKTEKKVEDLIGDVRCEFSQTPGGVPQRCVFEAQTRYSEKDIVGATRRYHRFGYAVFWVFDVHANEQRRDAEEALAAHMSEPPSLGLASLSDGELQLGRSVTRDTFEDDAIPKLSINELYVPTYNRPRQSFDHGDFAVGGERITVLSVEDTVCVSRQINAEGQRTLPQPAPWTEDELHQGIGEGAIERVAPVRGPP